MYRRNVLLTIQVKCVHKSVSLNTYAVLLNKCLNNINNYVYLRSDTNVYFAIYIGQIVQHAVYVFNTSSHLGVAVTCSSNM